jgi:hypothetical protein
MGIRNGDDLGMFAALPAAAMFAGNAPAGNNSNSVFG